MGWAFVESQYAGANNISNRMRVVCGIAVAGENAGGNIGSDGNPPNIKGMMLRLSKEFEHKSAKANEGFLF